MTRWLCLLPISLIADIAGYLLAPVVVPFANDKGWLPRWLWWFQTPDNPIDGDAGHLERYKDSSRYMRRVRWLWRNKMYSFSVSVLGARTLEPVILKGDLIVGDRPLREGKQKYSAGPYWQFYMIKKNPLVPSTCIRVNLGWKLWSERTHPTFGQYVCSVNPFMGYT